MNNQLAQKIERAELSNLQEAIVIALLNGYKNADEKRQKQFDEDITRIINPKKSRK